MTTFQAAYTAWECHECDSLSDICDCVFEWECPDCGTLTRSIGEALPDLDSIGGVCFDCRLNDVRRLTSS